MTTSFKTVCIAFYIIALLGFSNAVNADSRVVQVWNCELKDGKSVEDAKAIHGKWKAWANSQPYGAKISARVATPLVSSNVGAGTLLMIDVYPSIEAYAADASAIDGTKEGQSLLAQFREVLDCHSNALYAESDSD